MISKNILVSGCAGFVASNLIQRLLENEVNIYGIDDLSRGSINNMKCFDKNDRFHFYQLDIVNYEKLDDFLSELFKNGIQFNQIWHLAANSDISAGILDPKVDLDNTFKTTYNLIEIAKKYKINEFLFSSTSAIYGDLGDIELKENIGPLLPISNYGAMKLASEAIISAATELFLERAYIFRFPNVIGIPATHGVIFDFLNKLKNTPEELEVLGNGTQQKAYLHISDLVNAMIFITDKSKEKLNLFNIGNMDDGVTVKFIAEQVVNHSKNNAKIKYGFGNKGWKGDVPKFRYNVNKLLELGWKPKYSSQEAVIKAIKEIIDQNEN
jgi:UDP-glucose 4-epimerase